MWMITFMIAEYIWTHPIVRFSHSRRSEELKQGHIFASPPVKTQKDVFLPQPSKIKNKKPMSNCSRRLGVTLSWDYLCSPQRFIAIDVLADIRESEVNDAKSRHHSEYRWRRGDGYRRLLWHDTADWALALLRRFVSGKEDQEVSVLIDKEVLLESAARSVQRHTKCVEFRLPGSLERLPSVFDRTAMARWALFDNQRHLFDYRSWGTSSDAYWMAIGLIRRS